MGSEPAPSMANFLLYSLSICRFGKQGEKALQLRENLVTFSVLLMIW